MMGGVLWVEFAFSPPFWVHALIWIPTVIVLTLALLRLVKSTLLVLQYKHRRTRGDRPQPSYPLVQSECAPPQRSICY